MNPNTYLLFSGWHLKSLLRLVYVDVLLDKRFSPGFPCHSIQWVASWDMPPNLSSLHCLSELCTVWNSDISCVWSCASLPSEKRRRRTFFSICVCICFSRFSRLKVVSCEEDLWSNTAEFSYIIPKRSLKIDQSKMSLRKRKWCLCLLAYEVKPFKCVRCWAIVTSCGNLE